MFHLLRNPNIAQKFDALASSLHPWTQKSIEIGKEGIAYIMALLSTKKSILIRDIEDPPQPNRIFSSDNPIPPVVLSSSEVSGGHRDVKDHTAMEEPTSSDVVEMDGSTIHHDILVSDGETVERKSTEIDNSEKMEDQTIHERRTKSQTEESQSKPEVEGSTESEESDHIIISNESEKSDHYGTVGSARETVDSEKKGVEIVVIDIHEEVTPVLSGDQQEIIFVASTPVPSDKGDELKLLTDSQSREEGIFETSTPASPESQEENIFEASTPVPFDNQQQKLYAYQTELLAPEGEQVSDVQGLALVLEEALKVITVKNSEAEDLMRRNFELEFEQREVEWKKLTEEVRFMIYSSPVLFCVPDPDGNRRGSSSARRE